MRSSFYHGIVLIITLSTCAPGDIKFQEMPDENFNSYWYNGQAELTSYALKQSRYGELHEGSVVMIFVTEDFWSQKQVKKESEEFTNEDEPVSVLKLNYVKKFSTGIYDYSLMSSIFQPIDISESIHPLKISGTIQDWCGHAFYQFNHKKNKLEYQSRSYFEREGDQDKTLSSTFLEDQVWNIIRLDPQQLPVGKSNMIPSGFYCRLMHKEVKPYEVNTSIIENHPKAGFSSYVISFPELERTVEIIFSNTFPYGIESWSERYISGWGAKRKELTSTATRIKTIRSPYWEKNLIQDAPLRKKLFGPLSP